jgi:hypothetical protein
MGAKNVIKKVVFVFFIGFINTTFCQEVKYLLFDNKKDSIITIGKTNYYKIDKNLFDINRFNEIDTICKKEISEIEYISVSELWKEGKKLFLIVSDKKNLMLESYNQIFERIYVVEKITDNKYKRTRVWWVDY